MASICNRRRLRSGGAISAGSSACASSAPRSARAAFTRSLSVCADSAGEARHAPAAGRPPARTPLPQRTDLQERGRRRGAGAHEVPQRARFLLRQPLQRVQLHLPRLSAAPRRARHGGRRRTRAHTGGTRDAGRRAQGRGGAGARGRGGAGAHADSEEPEALELRGLVREIPHLPRSVSGARRRETRSVLSPPSQESQVVCRRVRGAGLGARLAGGVLAEQRLKRHAPPPPGGLTPQRAARVLACAAAPPVPQHLEGLGVFVLGPREPLVRRHRVPRPSARRPPRACAARRPRDAVACGRLASQRGERCAVAAAPRGVPVRLQAVALPECAAVLVRQRQPQQLARVLHALPRDRQVPGRLPRRAPRERRRPRRGAPASELALSAAASRAPGLGRGLALGAGLRGSEGRGAKRFLLRSRHAPLEAPEQRRHAPERQVWVALRRRDETCPVSTGGGTRRVQSVREGGGGGLRPPRARPSRAAAAPRGPPPSRRAPRRPAPAPPPRTCAQRPGPQPPKPGPLAPCPPPLQPRCAAPRRPQP